MNGTMTIIIILLLFSAAVSAITLTPDHTLHDSIPVTATFKHEIESSLNHVRDYVTSTTSFLVSILEESSVSKHRDYPAASASFQYSTVEDRYEKFKGVNSIAVEVTVSSEGEGEREGDERGEIGRGEGMGYEYQQ